MSYLVLARRWRPLRFDQLVGQPHVATTLLNGIRQGRVAHAYLFSGPRGVGKTTTARLTARAINCHRPDNGEPCGKCSSCVAINENRLIDIVEIDAASNRRIEEIRQLREGINYTPIEGKAKVYIIDEVHMLTTEAFNALLKTLEEPPAHAYFCLATTDPQKVPSTILSRCQRFDFRRVSISEIQSHLRNICEKDEIPFEEDALNIIARRADGSIRDSLSLLDQVIAFSGGQALKGDVVEVVGEVRTDLYLRTVKLADSSESSEAFRIDEELSSAGIDSQDFLLGLQQTLVQLVQVKSLGIDSVEINEEFIEVFKQSAAVFSENDFIRLLQQCSDAALDIKRNFDPRTRIQLLLLRFAAFDKSVVISDLLSGRIDITNRNSQQTVSPPKEVDNPIQLERTVKTETLDKSIPSSNESETEPGIDESQKSETDQSGSLSAIQNGWEKVCEEVAVEHNSSGKMLKFAGYPVKYEEDVLTIRFKNAAHIETAKSCKTSLLKAISSMIGSHTLKFEVGELPSDTYVDEDEQDEAVSLLKKRLNARPLN